MTDANSPVHTPRILAIDDTPRNLQILAEMLTRHIECDLTFATEGKHALDSVKEISPDLILLDVMMPGMTGFEVCAELKKSPATNAIPVIFLTAKAELEDIIKGFSLGAADYVVKPFNPDELIARVRTHLKIRESTYIINRQNEELRQLIHILCHDLANPLINIHYLVGLSNSPEPFPNAIEYIDQLAQSALSLIQLVRQMRALDESKQSLTVVPIHLLTACRQALRLVDNQLTAKQIQLAMDVPNELNVSAEEAALVHSILCNLLTNAIKFSSPGSTISICARSQPEGRIQLIIKDQGIGMPQKLLDALFDPARQTSRPGTQGETGTGFGMPLVRKFMSAFGGSIDVQSQEQTSDTGDHGTTCLLLFRVAQGHGTASDADSRTP